MAQEEDEEFKTLLSKAKNKAKIIEKFSHYRRLIKEAGCYINAPYLVNYEREPFEKKLLIGDNYAKEKKFWEALVLYGNIYLQEKDKHSFDEYKKKMLGRRIKRVVLHVLRDINENKKIEGIRTLTSDVIKKLEEKYELAQKLEKAVD